MTACGAVWIRVVLAVIVAAAQACAHAEAGSFSVLPPAIHAPAAEIVAGNLDARFQPLSGNSYIPKYDEYDVWLRIDVPAAPAEELRVLTIARRV